MAKELESSAKNSKALKDALQQQEAQIAVLKRRTRALERELADIRKKAKALPTTRPTTQP